MIGSTQRKCSFSMIRLSGKDGPQEIVEALAGLEQRRVGQAAQVVVAELVDLRSE